MIVDPTESSPSFDGAGTWDDTGGDAGPAGLAYTGLPLAALLLLALALLGAGGVLLAFVRRPRATNTGSRS